MAKVETAGTFKARVVSIELVKSSSSESVTAKITAEAVSQFDPSNNTWVAWPEGYYFTVDNWIVSKVGELRDDAVKRLMTTFAWNGDFTVLEGVAYAGAEFQCEVKADTYNGNTTYKGEISNRITVSGSSLADRFGSVTRAYAAEMGQIAPAPTPAAAAPVVAPPAAAVNAPAFPDTPATDTVNF